MGRRGDALLIDDERLAPVPVPADAFAAARAGNAKSRHRMLVVEPVPGPVDPVPAIRSAVAVTVHDLSPDPGLLLSRCDAAALRRLPHAAARLTADPALREAAEGYADAGELWAAIADAALDGGMAPYRSMVERRFELLLGRGPTRPTN